MDREKNIKTVERFRKRDANEYGDEDRGGWTRDRKEATV